MNIDELIRQAMAEGKFANLPGEGKPLNLDENPHADPDTRMAQHVLKSAGYTLPWIEAGQQIEQQLSEARRALQRAWEWRVTSLGNNQPVGFVEAEWQRAEERFRQAVIEINQLIIKYNLQVPSSQFQRLPLDVGREIDRVKGGGDVPGALP